MDKLEAIYWAVTIQEAKEGSEAAKEALRVENQLRAEKGQPTVEEALKAVADRA
ncbi:MAG: hypothetical protein ACI35M_05160 [Alistipes sp.]